MGQAKSTLSATLLEEYQDCTFFTKKEILHIHERFQQINTRHEDKLTLQEMLELPEIKYNPFRNRMCQVFSEDDSGNMSFEDFLDMMSVFSESATKEVKSSYAFRIYDFDSDGYLDKKDLVQTIKCLCGDKDIDASELEIVADKILEESDLDGDHRISYVEFEHIIARAPDFVNTFRIRI